MYERKEAPVPGRVISQGRRRASRFLVAITATALVVGTMLVPDTAGAQSCDTRLFDHGGWDAIQAPSYPKGSRTVAAFAVGFAQPNVIMSTNGLSVMRSGDGGCHWSESFTLGATPTPAFPYSASDSQITKIFISKVNSNVAYLLIDQLRPVSKPHVLLTEDGGESWTARDTGLETAQGSVQSFDSWNGDHNIAYLMVGDGSTGSAIYATSNAGQAWTPVRTKAGSVDLGVVPPKADPSSHNFNQVVVSPLVPQEIWMPGQGGLWVSHNSGSTVESSPTEQPLPEDIALVDVYRDDLENPNVIRAFAAGSNQGFISYNGGNTYYSFQTDGVVQSVTNAVRVPITAITTDRGVFMIAPLAPPQNLVEATPTDGHRLYDIEAGLYRTTGAIDFDVPFYARTETTIETRKVHYNFTQQDIDEFVAVGGFGDIDEDVVQPHIAPGNRTIRLERGETKTIDYDLELPGDPKPLDVFFLVDISGSMSDAINGMRGAMHDIVERLREANLDVYFGVGEYRSYSDEPAYRLLADIREADEELRDALNSLRANGGGEETQLEALYQVATGEGKEHVEGLDLPVERIAAGQDATWRPDSYRVIIHMTDEPISEGGEMPPYEKVTSALVADDAVQVGLAIQETNVATQGQTPLYGLRRVAAGSNALAPDQGADCNGDGAVDIAAGNPLVCIIHPDRAYDAGLMAPAIVNLLNAIRKPAPVALVADKGQQVVEKITPKVHTGLNFNTKDPSKVDFDVTFSCPRFMIGKRAEVHLSPTAGGELISVFGSGAIGADATVVCKAPPEEIPEPPPPLIPLAAIAPLVPPPPQAPDIIPNPNPQPQAQAQAQGAMAAQEQEEPQLAYAQAAELQERAAAAKAQEDYSMSSYEKKDRGVPPEFVWVAGLTMSMMYGCAQLARERVRVRTVKVRR